MRLSGQSRVLCSGCGCESAIENLSRRALRGQPNLRRFRCRIDFGRTRSWYMVLDYPTSAHVGLRLDHGHWRGVEVNGTGSCVTEQHATDGLHENR